MTPRESLGLRPVLRKPHERESRFPAGRFLHHTFSVPSSPAGEALEKVWGEGLRPAVNLCQRLAQTLGPPRASLWLTEVRHGRGNLLPPLANDSRPQASREVEGSQVAAA
eukprot:12401187-Karenia_brevis.AAC.1